MRLGIGVCGFFIIVLIVISGCSSTLSGATNGSKSQNSVSGDINVKTTSESSYTSSSECKPPDPVRLKKFLPTVPGWTGTYKQFNWGNTVAASETYTNSQNTVVEVTINDMGLCSEGALKYLNNAEIGTSDGSNTRKINNFHGYPAIHRTTLFGAHLTASVNIYINNRYFISIVTGDEGYPESVADAIIEKFASAIDFNDFAASL